VEGRDDAVTGGVDRHLDVHVAAVLDEIGGLLATESFVADRGGEDQLVGWLGSFGPLARVGVEGTGSGAGRSPPRGIRR
jgi:transposase